MFLFVIIANDNQLTMKQILNILILLSIVLFTSCNKEDREPEYTPLTIHRQFNTQTMPVKLSELKDFTEYKDKIFIVNSIDELPEDKYFSTEDFVRANINFSEYSLVIVYQLILGDIVTYQYGWCYDNWDESYQFNTIYDRIKDSEYVDGEIENFTYLRSAILVRRIPFDAKCSILMDIYEH